MSELENAYAALERIAKSYVEKSVGGQTPKSAKAARAVAQKKMEEVSLSQKAEEAPIQK
jgi:hypothetical protein